MRIAVMGGSGRIGQYTLAALKRSGHDAVSMSRSTGADGYTGAGLDEALAGVDVVVDVTNTMSLDEAEIVDFFGTVTKNLLAAEERAGVGHHVLLSIVGVDHDQNVPHYSGKREQERQVTAGPIPWSIVRATQFHDFAAMTAGWTLQDGTATVTPLLVQPIAQQDVGEILADVAAVAPLGRSIDIAGPETQDLVDMARRTFAARGEQVRLVPSWRGLFDTSMAGEVLLPGDGARLGSITFDDWLTDGAVERA
jgi:uncharacterized protein YbjT (DUF2867 family)